MEKRFEKYRDLIINKIEGGYYNPARHYTEAMGRSGETMFGIDRQNGGSDITESDEGQKFWAIIDANSAGWPRYYRGGANEQILIKLAGQMMYNRYKIYSGKFITPEARKLIAKSPRLESHFYYACWNGPGRFQQFGKEISEAVSAGQKNISELENIALQSRLNSSVALIRTGGAILRDKVWPSLPERNSNGHGWLWWVLAGVGIYFLTKK